MPNFPYTNDETGLDDFDQPITVEGDCDCMTYEVDGVIDVASYVISCPIHGWRWNYVGPDLTLEEAAAKDRENARS